MNSQAVAERHEVLSFEKIKELYPNQWVYIGDPVLRDPDLQTAIVYNLSRGTVLLHSTDRKKIAQNAKFHKNGFKTFACVWTGQIPTGLRFLL